MDDIVVGLLCARKNAQGESQNREVMGPEGERPAGGRFTQDEVEAIPETQEPATRETIETLPDREPQSQLQLNQSKPTVPRVIRDLMDFNGTGQGEVSASPLDNRGAMVYTETRRLRTRPRIPITAKERAQAIAVDDDEEEEEEEDHDDDDDDDDDDRMEMEQAEQEQQNENFQSSLEDAQAEASHGAVTMDENDDDDDDDDDDDQIDLDEEYADDGRRGELMQTHENGGGAAEQSEDESENEDSGFLDPREEVRMIFREQNDAAEATTRRNGGRQTTTNRSRGRESQPKETEDRIEIHIGDSVGSDTIREFMRSR